MESSDNSPSVCTNGQMNPPFRVEQVFKRHSVTLVTRWFVTVHFR